MKICEGSIQRYPITLEELTNLRVEVYRNLHKGKWSIRAVEGKYKGKVVYVCEEVKLINCEFKVSEKGREWVRENKVKKVHAVVRGNLINLKLNDEELDRCTSENEIYYNPYLTEQFIRKSINEPILNCETDILFSKNCKVYENIK